MIRFTCKGIHCPPRDDPTMEFDYVIVSTSAPITLGIGFVPPLRPDLQAVLRQTNLIPATKVLLIFNKPFWEASLGGVTTDAMPRQLYYPVQKAKSGKGVLLASYTDGGDAIRYTGMPDDEIILECLETIANLHNMTLEAVSALYHDGFVKKWMLDPHSLGAFTVDNKYQVVTLWIKGFLQMVRT